MNKALYILTTLVAGAICVNCSNDESSISAIDDKDTATVLGSSDSESSISSSSQASTEGTTPLSSDNSTSQNDSSNNSQSGETNVPSSSATGTDPQNPSSSAAENTTQNPSSSTTTEYVPISSSIGELSSSSLKAYEDNHAAKESVLPAAGFYTNLTIDPPTPTQGGQIKCTFDGSFPTQNSESISAAKQITENTVIRCSEFVNGQAMDTTTQTYFINENVSMPVIALTVNHHDMFDSTDGLYATGPLTNNTGSMGGMWDMGGFGATDNNNPKCTEPCKQANFWRDDELPVHVEFFENGSSTKTKNWEIDAGISIIGNYSRYKPKKSVAIKMDNDIYGDKTLKYSLFKTRPEAKKFKSFNLRNNGNRFWTDYIGDPMLTSLVEGTDVDYQRSRQVVVFYNGEYFGIHDMRERLNRNFVETNYDIDKNRINVVKNCSSEETGCSNGWIPSGTNGVSADEFNQVVNQILNGNFEGENNQQYAQLKSKFSVSSFAQYMMAEMYIHNGDWPNNNIRVWGGNGYPFKFIIFDVDHGYGFTPGITGFDTQSQNMFQWVVGSTTLTTDNNNNNNNGNTGNFGGMGGWDMGGMFGGGASTTIGKMFKKLLENPDFKRLFINQSCILLNDYLTYEKVEKAVKDMMATIPSSEQQRDEQRWPRNQSNFNWSPSGSDLLQFGRNRTETTRQEMATFFGLSNEVKVTLATSGSGAIFVDGMKLPSNNYTGKFFDGNAMELTAVASSGYTFTGWSDGSKDNPRIVTASEGANFTAKFK